MVKNHYDAIRCTRSFVRWLSETVSAPDIGGRFCGRAFPPTAPRGGSFQGVAMAKTWPTFTAAHVAGRRTSAVRMPRFVYTERESNWSGAARQNRHGVGFGICSVNSFEKNVFVCVRVEDVLLWGRLNEVVASGGLVLGVEVVGCFMRAVESINQLIPDLLCLGRLLWRFLDLVKF